MILLGKVAGDFLINLTVLLAGLPVLCGLLLVGGVSVSEIVSVHLILLGTCGSSQRSVCWPQYSCRGDSRS